MMNIAVFVSGGGTNLQALIDAQDRGEIKNGKITFVLASNDGAYALERAKKAGIESTVVSRKSYATKEEYDKAILKELDGRNIDLIVLAGFMTILDEWALKELQLHSAPLVAARRWVFTVIVKCWFPRQPWSWKDMHWNRAN